MERQLPGKTSLSVMYLDQHTTHMPQTINMNAPLPGTYVAGQMAGIRPYGDPAGNIFQYESGGVQEVKWLEVHVTSKLNPRFSLSAQYLLIDAHNDGGWDNVTPSNPYNPSADWGPASWAALHNFNLFGTVMAPWGVQVSPLFMAYSGQPYDLTVGADLNGDTVANDRPAFATDRSRPSVVVTKFGAFDTSPLPGQTIVPRNYLMGSPMWSLNMRVSKTFGLWRPKYGLTANIEAINILNHVNHGGYVGNLSSPLFGQSTSIRLFSDPSNNRKLLFGTQLTF
jgi:hypothetical protein